MQKMICENINIFWKMYFERMNIFFEALNSRIEKNMNTLPQ